MKVKKILSTALVIALAASSAAGCSNKTSGQAATASSKSGTTSAGTSANSINGSVDLQQYPISKEKITLKLWYPMANSIGQLKDYNDGEFWQWYEEKTGIHIEFIVPASNTDKDSFQLLFASNDMPDMVYQEPLKYSYRGGQDKAIDDGYFVNVNDYLDDAPNYMSWVNNGAESGLKKAAYSDAGKMYGMLGVWKTMGTACMGEQGLAIRKDYLTAVGLNVPTTYDEWHTVLKAFKDKLNIEIPLYTSKYGIDPSGELMAGYGTAPYFYQDNGTIKYGPLDDGYKEYLTMLSQWYQEGLLDHDFPTRSSTGITADNDVMLNDKVGSLIDYATRMSDTYVSRGASNKNFYLVAAPQPTKNSSTTPKYRQIIGSDQTNGYIMSFSASSKHIDEAIRWNDGFYAEDVYLNANYGLEKEKGVVWNAAADGHRIGNYDFRYSNPNGLDSATVLVKYWTKNPPTRVEAAQIEQSDDNKQASYKTWSKYAASWYIPERITLTSAEGTEFSSVYTDIETYVQECNIKFITGSMSLNDYDSYRSTLKQMGIERAMALKQAALDRYNKR